MRERLAPALSQLRFLMIAVARHAVLRHQFLVERGFHSRPLERDALARAQPYVGQGMASNAPFGRRTAPGCVAVEALCCKFGVATYERAGTEHEMRVDEDQRDQGHQIGRYDGQEPAPFHFQPQNRNTATMCVAASTANASVIGKWITRHCLTTSKVRLS